MSQPKVKPSQASTVADVSAHLFQPWLIFLRPNLNPLDNEFGVRRQRREHRCRQSAVLCLGSGHAEKGGFKKDVTSKDPKRIQYVGSRYVMICQAVGTCVKHFG